MEPKLLKGTALELEDFKRGKVFVVNDNPVAEYAWDCGVAVGRYLSELKSGRIMGRTCYGCSRTMLPPRMFCERCFRPTDEWAIVQDTGVINTFSLCYITWDMKKLKDPEIPAVIEIEGASKGMGILHLIGGCDPRRVKVGMKVRAVWRPEKERVGAITDIQYWTPIR